MEPLADPVIPFERLYREEGDRLWRALLLYCGDPDVASDAVSEAFAQGIRRGSALHSPRGWVWRSSFRIAAGELKRRSGVAPLSGDQPYEMSDETVALMAGLRQLSSKQRASIILKYCGGYSAQEIAEMIGSSASAVGVHLNRARKRLRQLLEEYHD